VVSVPVGEVPEAIARIARPLEDDDDLDRLVDLVAHERLVLLGESTHGTHEFYSIRAQLTRRLIEHHDFSAVAIEGDWPDAARVDRYVRLRGDDDSADEALASFRRFPTWMWRNRDVAELVEWLHDRNARVPEGERAGFYGLDLYSLHSSIGEVLAYLDTKDPEAAKRARERYACFDSADPQQYGREAYFGMREDCREEVVAQLVEQLKHTSFDALANAAVVMNAEAYYRAMFAGQTESWNIRDRHMADTVERLLQQLGRAAPAKLVIWAHNSHVGDARATVIGAEGQLTLGQLLRDRFPDDTQLVGFTTDHGTVECATDWDEPPHRERVRPAIPGSWEELFHESHVERFFVTAAELARTVGESAERLHRAIGVVYRPETERRSHYYHARLAQQYDVVIHIDETHAVHPLDEDRTLDQAHVPAAHV
jgi:erythromycin esterase-like protein